MLAALLLAASVQAAPAAIEKPTVRETIGPVKTAMPLQSALFLLDHPDQATRLARALRLAPYVIEPLGDGRYRADDGSGTRGTLEPVARSSTTRTFYLDGVHSGRVLPDISAEAVVVVTLAPEPAGCAGGVLSALDVSIKTRSVAVGALAYFVKPYIRRTMRRKLMRALDAAGRLGERLRAEPGLLPAAACR